MSHVTQQPNRETIPKSQRGKYWITGSVISHSPLIAPRSLSLPPFLSHAHRRKTQTFLSPPLGERVNGPLILRSEDQSQQGSHVCQIKKQNTGGDANMGATVHARAAGWIEKQKRDRERDE